MNLKPNLLITLMMLVTLTAFLGSAIAPRAPTATVQQAYIEPGLISAEEATISVIVTARDVTAAAEAVEHAGGEVSSELWLIDAVAATIPAENLRTLSSVPGVVSVVANKGAEIAHDSEGIVTSPPSMGLVNCDNYTRFYNTTIRSNTNCDAMDVVTDQAWPVAIDVGANQLHHLGIRGNHVTVAVVDSGIYFRPELNYDENQDVVMQFVGQANFMGDGICDPDNWGALQYDGYCFETYESSNDEYGHGSHVAGIIGNQYRDAATGVYLGIAPKAEILSIRVLGEDGTGTYEDVIEGIQFAVQNRDNLHIRVINLSLSAEATTPYFVDPLNGRPRAPGPTASWCWLRPATRAPTPRASPCRATIPT